jgi:DNA polymerase-3 subunit chi
MTVQADFYHLTRSPLTAVLPPLLDRTLKAGERAVILTTTAAQVAELDAALWLVETPDWLPHGTAATPHPEWQPIFITDHPANPADAGFLFLTHGAACDNPASYRRIFDLFDGNDEAAVAAARARWRAGKDAGWTLAYWKQGESGWEKAA